MQRSSRMVYIPEPSPEVKAERMASRVLHEALAELREVAANKRRQLPPPFVWSESNPAFGQSEARWDLAGDEAWVCDELRASIVVKVWCWDVADHDFCWSLYRRQGVYETASDGDYSDWSPAYLASLLLESGPPLVSYAGQGREGEITEEQVANTPFTAIAIWLIALAFLCGLAGLLAYLSGGAR